VSVLLGTDVANEAHLEHQLLVLEMCNAAGQPLAWDWFRGLMDAAQTWDHVVDGEAVDRVVADRAFVALTTEWPVNAWFQQHRAALVPALVAAIDAWRASDRPGGDRAGAFAVGTDVVAVMAWLLGGQVMVDRFMPRVRALALEVRRRNDG
jgi:hypothetical protein